MNFDPSVSLDPSVNGSFQLEEQFGNISVHDDGSYEYSEVGSQGLYVGQDASTYPQELYVGQDAGGAGTYCYEETAAAPLDSATAAAGGWECLSPDSKSLDSVVEDLSPEEVRWFYKCDADKRWLEFSGYDSLRIEFKYRQLFHEWQYFTQAYSHVAENGCDAAAESPTPTPQGSPEQAGAAYSINVRGGLYEVDLQTWKCSSIYWPGEECVITRGTWFYDVTWQPLDLDHSSTLESVHLHMFYGQRLSDHLSLKAVKPVLHTENFPHFHVDWCSPLETFLHSEAAPSKLVRSVTCRLGFHKPTGYRLYRGYKAAATDSDRPVDITHLVFVVHGIGHKTDQGRIIKNTTLLRDCVGWVKEKYHPQSTHRAEFFPVEWRTSLRLDGDIVEAITPQRILGLRSLLNSSAMDIMYYTSPLYGSEVQRGLCEELNRLYAMFTLRNPYFVANGGKVSVVAHSLGCVITYDIVTGWRPDSWGEPEENPGHKSRLHFEMDNLFCLGSPLSVFLALRWREPPASIVPPSLCRRLYNVFHPTDPVAYRMEPLLNRAYARVAPVQLQPYNAAPRLSYSDLPLELIVQGECREETDSPLGTPSRDRGWNLWGLMRGGWKAQDGAGSPQFDASHSGLQHRLDYVLRETSIGVSYLSALTSHTAYWTNYDVAYFVLTRLFPDLESQAEVKAV